MVEMRIVGKVVEKYKDDDLHVRRAAVEAMAQLAKHGKYRASIPLLFASYFNCTANLNDNSPRYVIRSLIDLFRDDDETIRQSCLECVSTLSAYSEHFIQCLRDGRVTDYRDFAENCQTDFKNAGLPEFMVDLLQDETREKRVGSLQAISKLSEFGTCILEPRHWELNSH